MEKHFGLRGKHTISTDDARTHEKLRAAGFEEYPTAPLSTGLRFVDGEWRDTVVLRHYGQDGRFTHSAHLNEDSHEHIRARGFEEYATRPPEDFQKLYVTADGGKTWAIDLPEYKRVMTSAVKTEALQRARQSFNPGSFEGVFKTAESDINAALEKAAVDAIVKNLMWPA